MTPLGLESGVVRVEPYDEEWPVLYLEEAARVTEVLAAHGVTIVLEHSGSTSVPGLAAKPIIDILGGREPETPRERVIEALQGAGYTYRGEQGIPGRDFFRRGDPRQYHLHLTTIGSTFWHDHRDFRDHLRSDPEAVTEYARLKHELAARYPRDREAYIEAKTEFVRDTLAKARR
jgi:GrpB-like predicted nucleotidyltransferase (UPF0157 family)